MAWLAARPEQTPDPKIAQLFIGGCDDQHRDKALQMIAKGQRVLAPIFSGLRETESPELLAINCFSTGKPLDRTKHPGCAHRHREGLHDQSRAQRRHRDETASWSIVDGRPDRHTRIAL